MHYNVMYFYHNKLFKIEADIPTSIASNIRIHAESPYWCKCMVCRCGMMYECNALRLVITVCIIHLTTVRNTQRNSIVMQAHGVTSLYCIMYVCMMYAVWHRLCCWSEMKKKDFCSRMHVQVKKSTQID